MPRTTYSDLSLPNFDHDCDTDKRACHRRKSQMPKKNSRNLAKPHKKHRRIHKHPFKKHQKTKGNFSPQHKIQIYDDDSASFQSDCIDKRIEDNFPTFDRNEQTVPYLDKDCERVIDRLVEESQRNQLVAIMQDCNLSEKEYLMQE